MSTSAANPHNPGPNWGFTFLLWSERLLPRWVFRPLLMLGTWVALPMMPEQRRHSRDYLEIVLGRRVGILEVWRHFFAFTDDLITKLRIARGVPHHCTLDPDTGAGFAALVKTGEPALFGTFHFGQSDLLGFYLGALERKVTMIRLRVSNSEDTRLLGRLFGRWVSFLWVNEPENLLFALKSAIQAGDSLAMKCDRVEFSAKTEVFHFLGCPRVFPFTIYHLALLFDRPVSFCVGVAGASDETRVIAAPIFRPDPALPRAENLQRARLHFQGVLTQLESLVRQHPLLWFNYLPLNPEPPRAAAVAPVGFQV